MAGSEEDAETGSAFLQDMQTRGLDDLLLVVSDDAAGIIKAIETCFPRSERQRCLAHLMRNLSAKVPENLWPEFKTRAQAANQAPSRIIARDLATDVVADFEADFPSAVACFMDDFEACIMHLRLPIAPAWRPAQPIFTSASSSRNAGASRSTPTPSARRLSSISYSAP